MNDLDYEEAIGFLYGLQKFGVKLGLERVHAFLEKLGDPHEHLETIHVAGTNGKGSTCHFLESMVRHAGLKVGLYTSPHIRDFTERVMVNNRRIEHDYVSRWVSSHRDLILELSLTFFESTTALAFSYFRDMAVDYAICEVGLGGRLDATNTLSPGCTVITGIGTDHQEQLGDSKEKIAKEKLGIVKENTPVTTGESDPVILDIIKSTARDKSSELHVLGENARISSRSCYPYGSVFSYVSRELNLEDVRTNVPGPVQIRNAALSILSLEVWLSWNGKEEKFIREGLQNVRIPGRLERLETPKGLVVLDVAHNADAAAALADALQTLYPDRKAVAVVGMAKDKDSRAFLRILSTVAREIIVTSPDFSRHDRRTEAADLFREASLLHDNVDRASSVSAAVSLAMGRLDPLSYVLVTGSFYTVSEACCHFERTGWYPGGQEDHR